mgnify:CR=1 FL=1
MEEGVTRRAKWSWERIAKEHVKEIREEQEWISQLRQNVADELTDNPIHLVALPAALSDLVPAFAAEAVELFATSVDDGWSGLFDCWAIQSWKLYAWANVFDSGLISPIGKRLGTWYTGEVFESAFYCAMSRGVARSRLSSWITRRVVQELREPSGLFENVTRIDPLFWFVLELCAVNGDDVELSELQSHTKYDPGEYAEILANWNDEKALHDAILRAADARCDRSLDEDSELSWFLPSVIPAEFWLLQAVRARKGLNTPQVDHPLFNSPLAESPSACPVISNELLARVVSACRQGAESLETRMALDASWW